MLSLKKGFTLIELLVVIAIIGILSGTVLVGLNSARLMAKDARAKANAKNIRTLIEMGHNGNYYPDVISAYVNLSPLNNAGRLNNITPGPNNLAITSLVSDNSKLGGYTFFRVTPVDVPDYYYPAGAYAVYSRWPSNSQKFYCYDSLGGITVVTTATTSVTCTP